jgi:hypothetical protein
VSVRRRASRVGTTVGVGPLPPDLSAGALTHRLLALLDRSCTALRWVAAGPPCDGLAGNLTQARDALAAGDQAGARVALTGFIYRLVGARGTSVTEPGWALLWPNAAYILSKPPQ